MMKRSNKHIICQRKGISQQETLRKHSGYNDVIIKIA